LNQEDLAKDYLKQADIRFETAKRVINENMYAYAIRQSQEAVELALKGAMRLIGVDFPKWHDIGETLRKEKDKFPENFLKDIPKLSAISEKLLALREPAMYGDENLNLGPSDLFNKSDTREVLNDTEFCLKKVKNLFETFKKR